MTGLMNAVLPKISGAGTVFRNQLAFRQGRRVGEITAAVKVEHVRDDKPICKLETVCNASGENCGRNRDDLHDAVVATRGRLAAVPGDGSSRGTRASIVRQRRGSVLFILQNGVLA